MSMQNHKEVMRQKQGVESNISILRFSLKSTLSFHSTAECTASSSNFLECVCFILNQCLTSEWNIRES